MHIYTRPQVLFCACRSSGSVALWGFSLQTASLSCSNLALDVPKHQPPGTHVLNLYGQFSTSLLYILLGSVLSLLPPKLHLFLRHHGFHRPLPAHEPAPVCPALSSFLSSRSVMTLPAGAPQPHALRSSQGRIKPIAGLSLRLLKGTSPSRQAASSPLQALASLLQSVTNARRFSRAIASDCPEGSKPRPSQT